MKKFNELFLYILNAFYYTIGSALIFIWVCDNIFAVAIRIDMYITLTLLYYFIIFTVCNEIEIKRDTDLTADKGFMIINIVSSIVLGLICAYKNGVFIIISSIMYYFIVFMIGLRANRTNTAIYAKIAKSFILSLIISSYYIVDKTIRAFGNTVIDFVIIYFVVITLYVIGLNFNEHYDGKNSINRSKNMFILNLVATAVMSAFTFFKRSIYDLFIIFKAYLQPSVDRIIHGIIRGFSAIVEALMRTDFAQFVKDRMEMRLEFMGIEEAELPPVDEIVEEVEEVAGAFDFSLIYNILFVFALIVLIVVLYCSIKSYRNKMVKKQSFEEKEFIFKREDFVNDIKKRFKNRFKKKQALPPERQLYKNTVKDLQKKGYDITNIMTPNEYISTIAKEDIEKYGFEEITSAYNACRYGKDNT